MFKLTDLPFQLPLKAEAPPVTGVVATLPFPPIGIVTLMLIVGVTAVLIPIVICVIVAVDIFIPGIPAIDVLESVIGVVVVGGETGGVDGEDSMLISIDMEVAIDGTFRSSLAKSGLVCLWNGV